VVLITSTSLSCSCDSYNGAYLFSATYTLPDVTTNSYSLGIFGAINGETQFCDNDALNTAVLPTDSNSYQKTVTVNGGDQYMCVMYHKSDYQNCGTSDKINYFVCPKAQAKTSMASIFTIFLPSLLFFIFFLAVIIRLLRRNSYTYNTEDEQQAQVTVTQQTPQEYEMSNIAAPVYPMIQMTNPNGQTVFVPQFAAPPAQIYTNGMPNVVYVSGDPASTLPPVYVATNPLPPQY